MSQPKLTLRPPPNVDFVQGYPGIPPGGPDRPQAAVKGAIEVRVGPQGVKAKWVRIELRKIETLPGGGVANTFFDFVGQSPINLWQSPNDEYNTLHTNDFPFFIRIPESIPPTISLEKGAGIKYELIASICVQGKKGFLRRDKPTITATASPIIIDKHELHSTWPIYSQPETRTHSQDGVTLVVERSHTCYGPGDRVVVMATVKSDTVHTVIVRGFEFMLRETTVFRAGPHTQGKKGSPQVKVSSIGEQKVPVNATLYGGTHHKVELSVTIPSHHTSATINAARHIDITYVLTVKALMSTGQPVIMDLPVMISNWPRTVSVEAMRRIGHAFNVSLPGQSHQPQSAHSQPERFPPSLMGKAGALSTSNVSSGRTNSSHGYSNSIDQKPSVSDLRSPKNAPGPFATSPIASDRTNGDRFGLADEFGTRKKGSDHGHSSFAAQTIGAINVVANNAAAAPAPARGGSAASSDTNSAPAARPRSSNGRGNTGARLTIANVTEEEIREHMEAEAALAARKPSVIVESPTAIVSPANPVSSPALTATPASPAPKSSAGPPLGRKWETAEEEKERLYKLAVANVERVQGRPVAPESPLMSQPAQSGSGSGSGSAPPAASTPAPSKPTPRWPTAEEEKARLFEEAQAAVSRAHNQEALDVAGPITSPGMSPGVAMYSQAILAMNRPSVPSGSSGSGSSSAPQSTVSPIPHPAVTSPIVSPTPVRQSAASGLPSAASEKEALRLYYEAKNAVLLTQSAHYGQVPGNADPMPYNALYPASQQAASPTPSQSYSQPLPQPFSPPVPRTPPAGFAPPPFQAAAGSSSQHPILAEKERLRRHYEAQDAAAAGGMQQPLPTPRQWEAPPPAEPYPGSPVPTHAYPQSPPMPPTSPGMDPRFSGYGASPPAENPPPFSAAVSPTQPLSAFDEKEMLRRRFEAQDAAARNPAIPPSPPPRASQVVNGARGRPPPTPPISPGTPGGSRPLTAAEEKARLRAMYAAEDSRTQRSPPPGPVLVPPPGVGMQMPYPSPPPSNGYHAGEMIGQASKSPSPAPTAMPATPPPPPPLAPKPPREYIEETQAEDLRTAAKLQAIDRARPAELLESLNALDPHYAPLAPAERRDSVADTLDDEYDEDEDEDNTRVTTADPGENTFGPGALSAAMHAAVAASATASSGSRPGTADAGRPSSPGAPASNGFPLSVPPPPPLPAKVSAESE